MMICLCDIIVWKIRFDCFLLGIEIWLMVMFYVNDLELCGCLMISLVVSLGLLEIDLFFLRWNFFIYWIIWEWVKE